MHAPTPTLPPPVPQRFTTSDFNPESKTQVESQYGVVATMPVATADELRDFLAAWNELYAIIAECGSQLKLWTSQYTDRTDYRDRYLALNRDLLPVVSEWEQRLGEKLLASPALPSVDEGTPYAPYVRQVRVDVDLFREENIPLERQINELDQRYGEVSGGWSFDFQGKVRTLSEMHGLLEGPDRDERRRVWETMRSRCFQDATELDKLFGDLFDLRRQVASNAGFENYRDYVFKARLRDYGPDACYAYHQLIEDEVVPLVRELDDQLAAELGIERLAPWDANAEAPGQPPLMPFQDVERLRSGVESMMRRLDGELGDYFALMRPDLDLEARPAKRQGGFMMTLPRSRRPFIFANATGRHSDIVTLLHEAGHAFHSILATDNKPMVATSVPMEFNEVASMSMEFLAYQTLDEFYGAAERERAIRQHLRRVPRLLASVAAGDSFQHWLYTHPDHTTEARRERWVFEQNRFFGHLDTSSVPREWLETGWHPILHFFGMPFYFIEYGFAYLGALQVAVNFERDPDGALQAYKDALALGPQRDTAGLYAAAGAEFVPTRERIRELMAWVKAQLVH